MKFIDNIIERAYFKRFPERQMIPQEQLPHVVITRAKPVAIHSVIWLCKRTYEQFMPREEVMKRLAQGMASELAKFIKIDSVEPIDEFDTLRIQGTIEILTKENVT